MSTSSASSVECDEERHLSLFYGGRSAVIGKPLAFTPRLRTTPPIISLYVLRILRVNSHAHLSASLRERIACLFPGAETEPNFQKATESGASTTPRRHFVAFCKYS